MKLQNRIEKLEQGCNQSQPDEIEIEARGDVFFISGRELTQEELIKLSEKFKKFVIINYIDMDGAKILEDLKSGVEVDVRCKYYLNLSMNSWPSH